MDLDGNIRSAGNCAKIKVFHAAKSSLTVAESTEKHRGANEPKALLDRAPFAGETGSTEDSSKCTGEKVGRSACASLYAGCYIPVISVSSKGTLSEIS